MDADTLVKKPVTTCDLLRMFPEESTVALLRRDHEYSEAGFYMVNLRYYGLAFVDHFAGLYLTGDIFNLLEWHDSYVLDRAIEQTGDTVTSLSGRGSATNHRWRTVRWVSGFITKKESTEKQSIRKRGDNGNRFLHFYWYFVLVVFSGSCLSTCWRYN